MNCIGHPYDRTGHLKRHKSCRTKKKELRQTQTARFSVFDRNNKQPGYKNQVFISSLIETEVFIKQYISIS